MLGLSQSKIKDAVFKATQQLVPNLADLKDGTATFKELGADSLDILEITMSIEDILLADIPDTAILTIFGQGEASLNEVIEAIMINENIHAYDSPHFKNPAKKSAPKNSGKGRPCPPGT